MLHFIYNPQAGNGRAERARQVIEPLLGDAPHVFHMTRDRGDATAIARQLTSGPEETDIIAMGGDGTLHEVLNGLRDPSRVRLGLIPCGSGNDFAATAGIPTDPARALDVILTGTAKPTDYLECSGVRGINAIGTGIDVDILRRYAAMKRLRGSAAYLASLILTVVNYAPKRFSEITAEGAEPHEALIACAANGRSFGGGIPIAPKAEIDDGLLDVIIIDGIKKPAIPGAFVRLMRRQVLDIKQTLFKRQTRLTVKADAPMPLQIDGEIYEDLPFDVRLIHGELRYYRP